MSDQTLGPRVPGDDERWRCAGCGNLTRFDVTRTRRTTDYWHFDLAGDHRVEEETVLAETVESVVVPVVRSLGRDRGRGPGRRGHGRRPGRRLTVRT